MTYPFYRTLYKIALPDPDMPQSCYHNILFVETNPVTKTGSIHEVCGDITNGMHYVSSPNRPNPETDEMFFREELVGLVRVEDYPDEFERVLRGVPPPKKQKAFNVKTMRTEQMKPERGFMRTESRGRGWSSVRSGLLRGAIPVLVATGVVSW